VAALREGDFSIRARDGRGDDALGAVMIEITMPAETLWSERLGAQEATALLAMAEIDVTIFAFDSAQRLALVNKYGERLLGQPGDRLLGRGADKLGLQPVLDTTPGVRELAFPGGTGRWEVRRTRFWQGGIPHDELNNSLAPIKSISGSSSRSCHATLRRPTGARTCTAASPSSVHARTR
jgi:hypothetical protein